jgi:hypothetical protein
MKTNIKELLKFTCEQMGKLGKGEIGISQAKAQAALLGRAMAFIKHPSDKAKIEMQLHEFNIKNDSNITIKDIEG